MKLLGHGYAREIRSSSVRFMKGDVLYGKMRPHLNKVWVAEFEGLCSAEFLVFSKLDGLNSRFLAVRLNAEDFVTFATGQVSGERPRVDFEKLSRFPITLPPTSEQDRIVAKLEASLSRVQRAETASRRAQERLNNYRATVLNAAVTGELTREWRERQSRSKGAKTETGEDLLQRILAARRTRWDEVEWQRLRQKGKGIKDDKWKSRYPEPVSPKTEGLSKLPEGWIWIGWDQIGFSQNGRTFPSKEYSESGVKLLRPGNLYADGSVRWTEKNTRYMPVKWERENPDFVIRGNELVINLTAQSLKDEFLGRVCLTSEGEHCLLNQRLARLTPIQGVPKFFLYMFKSSVFRRFVDGLNTGSLIQHMFTSQLAEFALPFPPEAEQMEIVRQVERRMEAADRLAATLDHQLERAQDTRRSLLNDAFDGRLIPPDPKAETASVLLERIRTEKARRRAEQKQEHRVFRPAEKVRGTSMQEQAPSPESLRGAWKRIGQKADARRLFEEAGLGPDQAVQFYEALRATPEVRDAFQEASQRNRQPQKLTKHVKENRIEPKGRFRLAELWLEDFKNLKDYTINFGPAQGLDVILGWNGTGKSNLFEALVIIFRDLHDWWEKNRWPDKPMNGYRLSYEIDEHTVEVTWRPQLMKRPELKWGPIARKKKEEVVLETIKRDQLPLPRFVFGYYSGPTNRLAEHFLPMKQAHYERLRKAKADDARTLAKLLEQRRFFCAETHHAKYVLLAFSYKEDKKISEFLENRLRILGFESALFVVRKPRWHLNNDPNDFWGAGGIMRRVMERLRRYAIAPMVLEQTVNYGYRSTTEDHYYFFLPNQESLHSFAAEYPDARTFFLALESTDFSELIHDVKIQVRVKATESDQVSITFNQLSEGEQQLLMVLGLMRFTKSHQSLVLLDEPDTHLNPHWSVKYLKDLTRVMSDNANQSPEQQTSQTLIATHDPLVIASLIKEQVHLLKRDAQTGACRWAPASVNPRGLGFTGILTSEMFGFRSDLDPETLADLDNRVRLIGKENSLTPQEKKELEKIDKRLADAGFSKAFSDPYYAAFVRAWGRRYSELMADKEFLTPEKQREIDRIAHEVLEEAVAEVEKGVVG